MHIIVLHERAMILTISYLKDKTGPMYHMQNKIMQVQLVRELYLLGGPPIASYAWVQLFTCRMRVCVCTGTAPHRHISRMRLKRSSRLTQLSGFGVIHVSANNNNNNNVCMK